MLFEPDHTSEQNIISIIVDNYVAECRLMSTSISDLI